MKTTARLFFIIICVPMGGKAQDSITRVDFTKSGRGYKEQLAITKDSVVLRIETHSSSNPSKKYSQKVEAKKWSQLRNLTKQISLTELPDLKSPTMKRAFDGALHGALTFTTDEGKTYTHGFDDEEPHPALHPIMECVQEIRDHALKVSKF